MALTDLAGFLGSTESEADRWRLVAEFLEEHRHEPADQRALLLMVEPASTGDERWDVFLAALAEHLAAQDGKGAAAWVHLRRLHRLWFPFDTPFARVDAIVHAPAAFRGRGIYVARQNLEVA